MKGIILAGGSGTRLYPLTLVTSKQLLPVYDKPMVYYPLSVLMLAGINEILIISSPQDINKFKLLFGNGNNLGIKIKYKIQKSPDGIAQAFIIGREFIGNDNVCLALGDNIFYGQGLTSYLQKASKLKDGAIIFAHRVNDPQRFGVVKFDKEKNVLDIQEKPKNPKSNFAITGLYFYDNSVIKIVKNLKPSKRGELEITDINKNYLKKKKLKVEILGQSFTWLDSGTCDSLLEASMLVKTIQRRKSNKIACIEEISFKNGWISKKQLAINAKNLGNNDYSRYIFKILKES